MLRRNMNNITIEILDKPSHDRQHATTTIELFVQIAANSLSLDIENYFPVLPRIIRGSSTYALNVRA